MKFKLLFLTLMIGLAGFTYSCKGMKESKKAKQADKQEIAQQKEAEKQHNKLVTAHHKRQAPKTKVMMGNTKKRSEYYNQRNKRNFFQRLFGINPKHKKPKRKNK